MRFGSVMTGAPAATLAEAASAEGPPQPEGYRWNKRGHRWFESWKTSQAVRDLAYNEHILTAIRRFTGSGARAFQTIVFDRGSNQRLHADNIHFQSEPRDRIMGAWIALEDIHPDAGPLVYVPGSEGMPFMDFHVLGLPEAKVDQQYDDYCRYEDFMERLVETNGWKRVPFLGKAGEAFLWGVDMLHGGMPIQNPDLTRKSLVVHYYLDDVKYGYAPMFGKAVAGRPYRKSGKWWDREGNVHAI